LAFESFSYEFSVQQFGNLLHKIIIMKSVAFGIFGHFGSRVDDPIVFSDSDSVLLNL